MRATKEQRKVEALPRGVVDRLLKMRAGGKLDLTVLTPALRLQLLEREGEKREAELLKSEK